MNPISVVLAFAFLSSLGAIFRWMFAAVPQATLPSRRVQPKRLNEHCIIVPVLESVGSMQAAELACQLAMERHAKVVLAYVIEIPFTLGLDAPLPSAEERAWQLLQHAEAIVKEYDAQVESRLLRHRKTEDAIVELAREIGAETIVIGAATASWWPLSQIGSTVSSLLQHAPCQVVVAKAPQPA